MLHFFLFTEFQIVVNHLRELDEAKRLLQEKDIEIQMLKAHNSN